MADKKIAVELTATSENFRQNITKATSCLEQMQQQYDRLAAYALKFSAIVGGAGFLGGLTSQAVGAGLALEKYGAQMKAITGSSSLAAAELKYIREQANRLGLDMNTTTQSFANFLGAARNTSIEGSKARTVFIGIAEGLAAMKLPAESAQRAFVQLQQMLSKGKLQQEDITTLSESLPGAKQMLADAAGGMDKLNKQLKDGTADSIILLQKLADMMHATFGGAAVEAAEQAQGAINRFGNELTIIKEKLGGSLLGPLATALTSIRTHSEEIKTASLVLGAVVGGVFAGKLTQALATWATTMQVQFTLARMEMAATGAATTAFGLATMTATTAMNALKLAFMTNPVGIIVGLLTTAVSLWMIYIQRQKEALDQPAVENSVLRQLREEVDLLKERNRLASGDSRLKNAPDKVISELGRLERQKAFLAAESGKDSGMQIAAIEMEITLIKRLSAEKEKQKAIEDARNAARPSGAGNEKAIAAAEAWRKAEEDVNTELANSEPFLDKHAAKINGITNKYADLVSRFPDYKSWLVEQRDQLIKNINTEDEAQKAIKATSDEFKGLLEQWDKQPAEPEFRNFQTPAELKAAIDLTRLSIEMKQAEIDTQERFYAITTGQAAEQRITLLKEQLQIESDILKATVGHDEAAELVRGQQLKRINEINTKLLEQKKILNDSTAWGAAKSAMEEYARAAFDIGAQTKGVITDFLTGLENALVEFVRHGKLSFSSLVNSILDDLARIAVRQMITGQLSSWMSGLMQNTTMAALASKFGISAAGSGAAGASAGAAGGTGAAAGSASGIGMGAGAAYAAIAAYGLSTFNEIFNRGKGQYQTMDKGPVPVRGLVNGLNYLTGGGLGGSNWRTTASGLSVGIEGGDLAAQYYVDSEKKKKFWGGKKRSTDYSGIDSQMQDYLDSSYSDVLDSIRVKSAALGNRISEEAVKGFTSATVKINLAGLDGEAQQKALADYFRTVSNEALALLVPDIASQIRLGEDATAAYARLNALKLTNNALLMKELELLGQGSGSKYQELLNTQREAELLGVDASTVAIQRRIWALEDEQKITAEVNATRLASLTSELELARRSADLWRSAAATLDQTFATVAAVGLSPEARLANLRGQFAGAVDSFRNGDVAAAGAVSSFAQELQAASRDYYASGAGFASDSAAIQSTLGSLSLFATAKANGADVQAAALQTQIDQMKNMNLTLNKIAASLDAIESKTSLAESKPLSAAA